MRFLVGLVGCLLVTLPSVESKKRPVDSHPDDDSIQRAVDAELRGYRARKISRANKLELEREHVDEQLRALDSLQAARFRSLRHTLTKNGSSNASAAFADVKPDGTGAPATGNSSKADAGWTSVANMQMYLSGSTGEKGDTELTKVLTLMIATKSNVPVTTVTMKVSHFGGLAPGTSRRRLLQPAAAPPLVGLEAKISVQGKDAGQAQSIFHTLSVWVQSGTATAALRSFGFQSLKVTSLVGGPENTIVLMPQLASCVHLTCMACASTPNCGWCSTSNKCFPGDRDPETSCKPAQGKTDLFQHWVFNPTRCPDYSIPKEILSYPTLVDPEHCFNKLKDADESGSDCGGSCKRVCARKTSGGSEWADPKIWGVGGDGKQVMPRFKAEKGDDMMTPGVRIVGENPMGSRTIIPGTNEISSTEMGSGFRPAEYHSVGTYHSNDESGATVMITPTN